MGNIYSKTPCQFDWLCRAYTEVQLLSCPSITSSFLYPKLWEDPEIGSKKVGLGTRWLRNLQAMRIPSLVVGQEHSSNKVAVCFTSGKLGGRTREASNKLAQVMIRPCNLGETCRCEDNRVEWLWLRSTDAPFIKKTSSWGNRQPKLSTKAIGLFGCLQKHSHYLHGRAEKVRT